MENSQPPSIWSYIQKFYKIQKGLGSGSFGSVVQAQNRKTGQIVAIKLIKDFNKSDYLARMVLREIMILR